MIVYCEVCGKEHGQRPANIKRGWGKYCSKSCAIKARRPKIDNAVCLHCSKPFHVHQAKLEKGEARYCSIECKRFGMYPQLVGDTHKQCLDCKQVFERREFKHDKRGKIYARCNDCQKQYQSKRDQEYKARLGSEKRKEQLRQANKKYAQLKNEIELWNGKSSIVTPCECKHCNKKFINKGKQVKRFCSNVCGKEYRRINRIGKPLTITPKEYKCRSCKSTYIGKSPGRCDECKEQANRISRKANKKKRKAKLKTIAIDAVVDLKVFQRDKWRCKECGCKVQKKNIYEDNAAELDHIVPISLGGPHSYSNVQTLCRRCNQNKSNNYNGQLILCL